ncbi:hypothetical protein AX16_006848 [Volvariella volvacea WC 439]|nr:hypothetical protein AX16_006848 [Volvariella volvacea WC 439]
MAKGSKKRTITLISGDTVDLSRTIPINGQVIDAMRARIIELEDQLEALQAPNPNKRQRTAASAAAVQLAPGPSKTDGPSAGASKAEEKKRKMQLKKIYDRLKKECKSDNVKFQGSLKTIKFDEVYEPEEFQAIYGGYGLLIQPTPENKPKSAVTIISFNAKQVLEFFGDELKGLKGNRWTIGGMPARRIGFFGGGEATFTKSEKIGPCDVIITFMEVQYSKNNMKCTLKFDVAADGDGVGPLQFSW